MLRALFNESYRLFVHFRERAFLDDEVVKKIARHHRKTPAQILIRRACQRDLIVVCRSTDPERIRANISVSETLHFSKINNSRSCVVVAHVFDWLPVLSSVSKRIGFQPQDAS